MFLAVWGFGQTQPDPRILVGQAGATTGAVLKWDGTKWAPGTDNDTATTVGAYQTTGTANAASVSGSDIRIHSASGTTPGAVDLTDGQIMGDNTKVFQKNLNGETVPLVVRNNAAAGADAGTGIQFQAGASNAVMALIQSDLSSGTASTGALTYFQSRNQSNGLSTHLTFLPVRETIMGGFWKRETRNVTANFNVTTSLNNRYGLYKISTAGITLTLPLETDLSDGVEIAVSNITTSGADATVNTAAAYSEFMFDYDLDAGTAGNQFFAASLAIPPGKSYMLTSVSVSGTMYWRVALLQSAASSTTYAIGAYQTTGTANAASISGTDIRIHSASGTTPGAVDLSDGQVMGDNTKIFQESNAVGVAVPLIIRNPTAQSDDNGASIIIQGGGSNISMGAIESVIHGGSIAGGTSLDLYTRTSDNTLRNTFSINNDHVAVFNGWEGGSMAIVGTSLDVSSSLTNRKANFQFTEAGGTLTLPIPGNEGYLVHINSVYESGANGTINTGAAYSEFAWDADQDASQGGNQFYTETISVPPMQSMTIKTVNVGGQMRWKVVSQTWGAALANKQNRLGQKQLIGCFTANAATGGTTIGTSMTVAGAYVSRSITTTNRFTAAKRFGVQSPSGPSQQASWRVASGQCFRGAGNDGGGFDYITRFGIAFRTANCNGFFGLCDNLNIPLGANTNPSSLTNCIGVGWDAGQTTFRLIYNDASGTATTTNLGASYPCNTQSIDWYELQISCVSGISTVSVRLKNLSTGSETTNTISTNIPATTSLMTNHAYMSTNSDNGTVVFDVSGFTLETDY